MINEWENIIAYKEESKQSKALLVLFQIQLEVSEMAELQEILQFLPLFKLIQNSYVNHKSHKL